MSNNSLRFYGYKHWTTEPISRCFYVGKGTKSRPYSTRRSKKWHNVVSKFGIRIEIVIGPISNDDVIKWEIDNIASENTYTKCTRLTNDDIVCNFTLGGDGATGHTMTDEGKKNVSEAQKNRAKSQSTRDKIRASLIGKPLSESTKSKMSDAHKGKSLTEAHRANLWSSRSRTFSDSHKKKLSDAARQRRCGLCKLVGHNRLKCPQGADHERSKTSHCST